ncbi:Calx-beta domain-containing protein [Pontibacter pudoricolor]|uniref:Calx-beta domain-containing protein n=1 Tax=Pontibacter pudoricolor TaxID=2694930 RepID=UPI0013912114|nr:Calx-beta domain-containing protein [Pontibacter pudoricolor]
MKRFINKLFLSFGIVSLVLGATSCDDPEDIGKFEGPNFIALDKAAYSVAENSTDPLTIKIGVASTPVKEDVTVNYTLGGTAIVGEDYTVASTGSVVIPKGGNTAEIVITPLDNDVYEANKTVVVTITSTSADFPIGLSGNSEKTKRNFTTVTIVNEDCPLIAENFVGTYTALYEYAADPADGPYEHTTTVALDPEDETGLLISNFWGDGVTVKAKINGCSGAVTIPSQNYYVHPKYGQAKIQSVSTIASSSDIKTGNFKLSFAVTVAAGSFGNYTAKFTKQN